MLITNILAFLAFCAVSSSVYVLNDIVDVEADRSHHKKRYRPIAAGEVTIKEGKIFFFILLAIVVILAINLNIYFITIIFVYLIINFLYSFFVKNIVILDVFFISFGFMLRVLGGAAAIDVSVSSWMVITTIFLSLFLGISKRRAELSMIKKESMGKQRRVLDDYDIVFADQMNTIAATGAILSYALYTVSDKAIVTFNSDKLIYTTPFVIYGIFRYLYLIHKKNLGESPTQIVTKDIPIIVNSIFWLIASLIVIYKSKLGF